MNSEFSMPGKLQYVSTHITSHNPLTTLKPLPQLRLTSGIQIFPEPLEEAGLSLEIPQGLSSMLTDVKNKPHHFLISHIKCI